MLVLLPRLPSSNFHDPSFLTLDCFYLLLSLGPAFGCLDILNSSLMTLGLAFGSLDIRGRLLGRLFFFLLQALISTSTRQRVVLTLALVRQA